MRIILIVSFILSAAFSFYKSRLERSWRDRPLPENVRDVYDEAEYEKWRAYQKDGDRPSMIKSIVDTVVMLIMLVGNVYAKIYYAFDVNVYLRYFLCILITSLISCIISIPFEYYDTFVIEEKYGMNKTTKKTFVLDQIKNELIGLVMSYGLLLVIMFLYNRFGNAGIVWIAVAIVVISLLISLLVMPLLKIFNKFKPLEDGELKDKLMELCTKYGITVRKIVVKDASRRTTTANAFCTGFGKRKTISLDDNLINDYSTDQIVAVFAHEFAHARFRHLLKSLPFGLARTVFTVLMLGLAFNIPSAYTAFGFTEMNYCFAMTVSNLLSWPIDVLLDLVSNKISRDHEYEADAFAAREGYGENLVSALKKLCKESLSDINPHPVIVKMDYSHPTLSQRIEAIVSCAG